MVHAKIVIDCVQERSCSVACDEGTIIQMCVAVEYIGKKQYYTADEGTHQLLLADANIVVNGASVA